MLKILKQPKYTLPFGVLLILFVIYFDEIDARLSGFFESKKPPVVELHGKTGEVSKYQYLGSWSFPDGNVKTGKSKNKGKGKAKGARSWRDAVRVNYNNEQKVFHIDASESMLDGSIPRQLTPGVEDGVYKRIRWQDNQVSVFAFRVLAPQKQVAVVAIDTDNTNALYVNGRHIREVSAAEAVELGANLLIPVSLEAGENVVTAKILSNEGPPRLRIGMIPDQSKDLQAAWSRSWGFLSKLIHNETGNTFETPVVKWDALLRRLTLGAEIHDILNEKSMFTMDAVRSGDIIKDGGRVLGEGIYKITYKSRLPGQEQETFEEYFMVGEPGKALESLRKTIDALPWSDTERLNVDAHVRRARILFRPSNYAMGDRKWEEKVLWTLGNLARFINLKKVEGRANRLGEPEKSGGSAGGFALPQKDIFKNLPGLRLGSFVSKLDNSRQHYRLYVPSNCKAGDKLPLLLIMHTTMGVNPRHFLESPFMAAHREAVHVSAYAEKHGFAVLWPGYRSSPMWWTYESAHAMEAIADVERHHNIDSSRISLYGTCSGGFLAARLATAYPNYFAAIVYDRAIFERDPRSHGRRDDATGEWIRAINPSSRIIENKNIKIIVLNDGARGPQHGPITLSRQFLRQAQAKRDDVTHALGQRKIGAGLWNSIFEYIADCRNEQPDSVKVDIPAASGYVGPISEVFATPFIVVVGTRTSKEDAGFMDKAVENLKEQYRKQFFNVEFVLKKDTEIMDEDIERRSLVLVGNAGSNAVWGRLAAKYAAKITPREPADDWPASSTESVFAEVFKNPGNKETYLLLIGADKLKNLALLRDFNPFTACFDSYVYKYRAGREREYITARTPPVAEIPNSKITNSKETPNPK